MNDTVYKHCWLLDLDRTVSSVDVVMQMVEHVCQELSLDYSQLAREHALTEAKGVSFVVTDIVKRLWPNQYDVFCDKLKKVDHLDSVFPDAADFISWLVQTQEKFVVITYGDQTWQSLKLHFAGLDTKPHIITASSHKAELLHSWAKDGYFMLETSSGPKQVQSLTLVDNKAVAFQELPEAVDGYCIDRRHIVHSSDLPNRVPVISTFNDVPRVIKS